MQGADDIRARTWLAGRVGVRMRKKLLNDLIFWPEIDGEKYED
jgi:hypothetical protein